MSTTTTSTQQTPTQSSRNLMLVFLAVSLVLVVGYGKYKYAEAKTTAKARANMGNCLAFKGEDDEDGKWVKTPAGFYRQAGDGKCVAGTPPPPPPPQGSEALVLEHECFTPCKTNIAWRFKIIWGDAPLRIEYPGGQIVDRYGKDEDFQAPSNMRSGDVKFTSLDPDHLHFRVQVYRVVVR